MIIYAKFHYTYIITDHLMDKYYIGARSSDVLPMLDEYMGSSSTLTALINERGDDEFTKTILGVWPSRDLAILHEMRLHILYDVDKNPQYYNRAKQTSVSFYYSSYGEDHHTHIGTYVTPWGSFESLTDAVQSAPVVVSAAAISSWCKSGLTVTKHAIARSVYLTDDMTGKTTTQLGFSFISNGETVAYKRRSKNGCVNEYITPWGVYNSKRLAADNAPCNVSGTSVSNWCKNDGVITNYTLAKNDLFTYDQLGVTYKELGFDFRVVPV